MEKKITQITDYCEYSGNDMEYNSLLSINTVQTLLAYFSSWIVLDTRIIHFIHQYNQHKLIHHLLIHVGLL
jgi:hypothetical protein